MTFRRNPLPRDLPEFLCFLTVAVLVPLGFLFDILVVVPDLHEPGGFLYNFTLLLATFIFVNLEGNLLACMLIDTSVEKNVPEPPHETEELLGWKHCKICCRLAPPRSWHCKVCGVCILKRDHHCAFTGYCVGHQNQRYFVCFSFYTTIGSIYAFVYNTLYIWRYHRWFFVRFAFDYESSNVNSTVISHLSMLVYMLNTFLLLISTVVFLTYMPSVFRGETFFETRKKQGLYNNGLLCNLQSVFGQRMYLAWLFPAVKSPLPEDGYNWNRVRNDKLKL